MTSPTPPLAHAPRLPAASLAVALSLVSAVPVAGQYEAPPPPAAWALEGVTVVQSDGSTVEGATVVVRGDLVETTAPGAPVPADARRVEGDSLWVYPGLVDAYGKAEVSFPEPEVDRERVPSWAPPRALQGFLPHRVVAHHLAADGDATAAQRRQGVVAAAVFPETGLMPGQGSALVLRPRADVPRELVALEAVGMAAAFEGSRAGYPGTLFGVIAYLRQAFLDARHYRAARRAWDADPTGMTPPAWDPDHEAVLRVLDGELPVFFEAERAEDVRRVLALADEFDFRPVIVGGGEAWREAERLAREDVPVLVSLAFPDPEEWDPDDTTAALDPAAAREKERLEDLYANAGRLAEAGVRFALTSGGGDADLLEGARKAVEYGLSESAALAALTTAPAALVGLRGMGRVEPGVPATFVVTDGPLFEEGTRVVHTFVEGAREEGAAAGAAGGGEAPAADVSGPWETVIAAQGMSLPGTMTLEMAEDGSVTGSLTSQMGEASITGGTVSGREVSLTIEAPGMPAPLVIEATLSDDGLRMEGGGESEFTGAFDFEATRGPGLRWLRGGGGR